LVTIPRVPIVAMNAKASGMPPKLAATPEKVAKPERTDRGVRSMVATCATGTRPRRAAR
jgi:hypothetical protein